MDADKLKVSATTDGQPPRPGCETAVAPAPINPATGQHEAHWILSDEERAKGFIRPVRRSYTHVGCRPKGATRELTAEEHEQYDRFEYVCFEPYESGEGACTGRFWTQKSLDSGCGAATSMPPLIAETYARQPDFYGSTFCVHCCGYFRVGAEGEFVWDDGSRVGT